MLLRASIERVDEILTILLRCLPIQSEGVVTQLRAMLLEHIQRTRKVADEYDFLVAVSIE